MACDDDVTHTVWRVSVEDAQWFTDIFASIPALYVADGHHRTAAAYNVGKERRAKAIENGSFKGTEDFCYFMSILYPANNLLIMDYNRLVKSLNGMSIDEFKARLAENFDLVGIP